MVYLNGLRVLEVGDSTAAAAAASMLQDFGATVLKLCMPGAPPGRRDDKVRREILDAGKSVEVATIVPGLVAERARNADVVLVDRVGGWPIAPMVLDGYLDWVTEVNQRAWVTISAFGLTGPLAGWTGSDLVAAASSGFLDCSRDEVTGDWLPTAGAQSLLAAGAIAALAACHAIDRYRATSRPAHADVSAQEAALCVGPAIQCSNLLLGGVGEIGKSRMGAPNRSYPCTDGYVHISAMEDRHWRGVAQVMGFGEWAEVMTGNALRLSEAARIDAMVAAWTTGHAKHECETLLQAAGVPATAVTAPSEIPASPQFIMRGAVTTVDIPALGPAQIIGRPYAAETHKAQPGEPAPDRTRAGLAGLRVLEASHVLSIPLTGAVLGAMGADVIKLEDPRRPEFYRRSGPFIDGERGPDRGVLFAMSNHSKRSCAVSLTFDDARLRTLFGQCDVWIENLGAQHAKSAGIDAVSLSRRRPGILALSSSGYGHEGPGAGYRVYAYNIQAACGMSALTKSDDGTPGEFRGAWADFITGYYAAALIAAWAISDRDAASSTSVDLSMAELAAGRHNEFIAARQDRQTSQNDLPGAPRDWVVHLDEANPRPGIAISASAEKLVRSLSDILGPAAQPALDSAAAAALVAALRKAHAAVGVDELCQRLQAGGIPCAPVLDAEALVGSQHLGERGLFPRVAHPVWGSRRMLGLPWSMLGEGRPQLQPPPPLGSTESW
jgi:crotonobetainyl-CoA:carnitine CoA-transferase CaiB-like acyl-CoA transferase